MLLGLAHTAAAAQLTLLSLNWDLFIFSFPSPSAICNMICPCPGWQMEKQDTRLFAVMVLHRLNWPVKLQCSSSSVLAEQPFWRPLQSLCHCCVCANACANAHLPLISLLLPGKTLAFWHLSFLLVDITKLSVLPGSALTFTLNPSLKISPLVFGNFQFLLVSY